MKSIAFPFRLDSFGRATVTDSANKAYLDRLYTLLSTPVGTRPMNPAYGIDVHRALFESMGDELTAITNAISVAIGKWLPVINLEKVEITEPNQDGEMYVNISVSFPDSTTSTLKVSADILQANGTIQ